MSYQLPLFPRRVRLRGIAGTVIGPIFPAVPGNQHSDSAVVHFDGNPTFDGDFAGCRVLVFLDDCEAA